MAEQPDVDQDREQMPQSADGCGTMPASRERSIGPHNAQASAGPPTQQPAASDDYLSAAENSLETSAGSHPQPAPHATGNPAGSEGREPRPSHTASDHGTDLQTAPAAPALAQSGPLPAAGDDSSNPGNSAEQAAIRLTAGQLFGAIGLGIAIALVGIGGFLLGLMHVFRQDERVRLEIDPAALDLGEVWAQSGFVCELPVRNTGTQRIVVRDVRTSCDFYGSVKPRQFRVAPGGEQALRITLDLAAMDAAARDNALADELALGLSLIPAGRLAAPVDVVVRARLRRAFKARPAKLMFGGRLRPAQGISGPIQQVELEPVESLAGIAVTAPQHLHAWLERHGTGFRLFVQPRETVPAGPFRYEVLLFAQLASGETLPPYGLQVVGTCIGDLELLPAALHFAIVEAGERAKVDFVVRSFSRRRLVLLETTCDHPGVQVSAAATQGQGVLPVKVELAGLTPGIVRANLRLKVAIGEGDARELLLPISACVVQPRTLPTSTQGL